MVKIFLLSTFKEQANGKEGTEMRGKVYNIECQAKSLIVDHLFQKLAKIPLNGLGCYLKK
jgi:hypothetical protein